MPVDKISLKLLKKELGYGGIKGVQDLARDKGITISYQHVCNVLRGDWYRQDIIDIAFEYIKNRNRTNELTDKKDITNFKKKLNDIIK